MQHMKHLQLVFYLVPFLRYYNLLLNENKSSDVMVNYLTLGISVGNEGLDPTPITIYSDVTNSDFPSSPINSTV